jgi:hypothetical protein
VTGTITVANIIAGAAATQQLVAGDFFAVITAIRAGAAYANVQTTIRRVGRYAARSEPSPNNRSDRVRHPHGDPPDAGPGVEPGAVRVQGAIV